MEITGRLILILNLQTGEGKNGVWKKQDFVIETNDQYPKKLCISAWGDKVDELNRLKKGDLIKVFFDIQSREYNGKWYTDIRAWRIQPEDGKHASNDGIDSIAPDKEFNEESNWEGDLPF